MGTGQSAGSRPNLKRKVHFILILFVALFAFFNLQMHRRFVKHVQRFMNETLINAPPLPDERLSTNWHCVKSQGKTFEYVLWKNQTVGGPTVEEDSEEEIPGKTSYTARIPLSETVDKAIYDFNRLMSLWDVETVLLEPSILYCMLDKRDQGLLLKRGYPLTFLLKSSRVVNFGLFGSHSFKLNNANLTPTASSYDFKHHRVQAVDRLSLSPNSKTHPLTTHHFFVRKDFVIHAVVFYERSDYFWHGGLAHIPAPLSVLISKDELLFAQFDSAYERFQKELAKRIKIKDLFVPSHAAQFLLQMMSSKYIECTRKELVLSHQEKESGESHTTIGKQKDFQLELESAAVNALKELKKALSPLLMQFFIFSGTFLGWYRNCGLIPHTTDVDFASFASEIDDVKELMKRLTKMHKIKLSTRFGLVNEGLEFRFFTQGKQIDFFYLYEEKGKYWTSGHVPLKRYYLKYWFPKFDLCSAELFRQKVLVACQAEEMVRAEYGPQWAIPEKSWYFEDSPKNVGEKKYWPRTARGKTYINYS